MKGRAVLWLLIAVVVLMIGVIALPVFSTLQPAYYERYPVLAPRMAQWEHSTHSRISCAGCHMDPGVGGAARFAARAVPAFYSQLFQGPSQTNLLQAPSRAACQKCHTAYRKVSPGGDLRIPHRAHVEVLKMECVTCHKDLVHSLSRRGYNRPEMETCIECHDGETASNRCTECHTRKQVPAGHKKPDWLKVHGSKAKTEDCGACHDWTPDYCADCHQRRPASHVGNWKTGHGPEAKARGEGCLVCHGGEKFCKKCH